MAELTASFRTLEDISTAAGVPLHKAVEGDVAAGKNSHGVLPCKRTDTGVLRYIPLNPNDAIPVTFDTTGQASLHDEGGVTGSTSFQTLAELTLVNDAVYKEIGAFGSCSRETILELVQIDDSAGTPVETIHWTFRASSSAPNEGKEWKNLSFTAGSVGICLLRLRAKLTQNNPTDIDGFVSAFEQQ